MNDLKFPLVKRARGYRLYGLDGRRYLDMYLDNGRALLGHRPEKIGTVIKNSLQKNTLAEYPSVYTGRLAKALHRLFPGHPRIRVYRSLERLCTLLNISRTDITEPADPNAGPDGVSYWRPLLKQEDEYPDVIIPILPVPGEFMPAAVCFRETAALNLPETDTCSPVLAAALVRAVFELEAFEAANRDMDWGAFEVPGMVRKRGYLFPVCTEEEYGKLFRYLKKHGVLINPNFREVTTAPAVYTDGEIKVFSKMPKGEGEWI